MRVTVMVCKNVWLRDTSSPPLPFAYSWSRVPTSPEPEEWPQAPTCAGCKPHTWDQVARLGRPPAVKHHSPTTALISLARYTGAWLPLPTHLSLAGRRYVVSFFNKQPLFLLTGRELQYYSRHLVRDLSIEKTECVLGKGWEGSGG